MLLVCVRNVENDLLLMATHFIEKDREYRNTSQMRGSGSSRRSRMVGRAPLTLFLSLTSSYDCFFPLSAPKGRPGMSDVHPLSGTSGLFFDSPVLSLLFFFCLLLLLCLVIFLLMVHLPYFFPENSQTCFVY